MINFKLDVRTSDIEGQDKMNTVESLKYYRHKADFNGLEQSLSQIDWNTFYMFQCQRHVGLASFSKYYVLKVY